MDLKYALRQFAKSPGFTLTVILTLAVGIGASVAIYSVIDATLLNPIPAREPERLIEIGENTDNSKGVRLFGGVTTLSLETLQKQTNSFADLVWVESFYLESKTEDFIEGIGGNAVSPNFFAQWNVVPIMGRVFAPDEAVRRIDHNTVDRDAPMVINHALWHLRFGGSKEALGKTIEANGRRFTVIGVMPPHFQFPNGARPSFWIPEANAIPNEQGRNIRTFARLKPDITPSQTRAMLDTLAAQLLRERPDIYGTEFRRHAGPFEFMLRPLQHAITQAAYGAKELQKTLYGLLAAIGFVLLIACVNVANLMLARTENRQRELAIRAAVGAGKSRLLRQMLTESLLLAGGGALAGVALAVLGIHLLVALIPEDIPRLRAAEVDAHVLVFSALITAGAALIFGLAPAWRASRTSMGLALKQSGVAATASLGWRRYRSALVAAEVAISLALLTGAGLMISTVTHLLRADPGFKAQNLLVAHPGLQRNPKRYVVDGPAEARGAFFEELREQFGALPGVEKVGIVKIDRFDLDCVIDGQESPVGLRLIGIGVGKGDPFRAMHIPLRAGRYFEKMDITAESNAAIVNETMARLCWPGQSAVGKRFREKSGHVYEVVGVAGDARMGLRNRYVDEVEPTFFRPYHERANYGGFGPYFVIRTEGEAGALIPAARDTIKKVEGNMTTPWFQIAKETLYRATEGPRLYTTFLAIFAVAGTILAAIGIYGVLSHSVSCRSRELGIRLALGARRQDVLCLILGEGSRMTVLGIAVGLLASFWLTRLLKSQLVGISPTDPGIFATGALLLFAISLAACWLPARRASLVDPMETLRGD